MSFNMTGVTWNRRGQVGSARFDYSLFMGALEVTYQDGRTKNTTMGAPRGLEVLFARDGNPSTCAAQVCGSGTLGPGAGLGSCGGGHSRTKHASGTLSRPGHKMSSAHHGARRGQQADLQVGAIHASRAARTTHQQSPLLHRLARSCPAHAGPSPQPS